MNSPSPLSDFEAERARLQAILKEAVIDGMDNNLSDFGLIQASDALAIATFLKSMKRLLVAQPASIPVREAWRAKLSAALREGEAALKDGARFDANLRRQIAGRKRDQEAAGSTEFLKLGSPHTRWAAISVLNMFARDAAGETIEAWLEDFAAAAKRWAERAPATSERPAAEEAEERLDDE